MDLTKFVLIFIFVFTTNKAQQQCGNIYGGVIIQKIIKNQGSVLSLFADEDGKMCYIDGENSNLCVVYTNSIVSCTKINNVSEIIAAFPINETKTKLIGLTSKNMIYLNLEFNDDNQIVNVTTDKIDEIEKEKGYNIKKGMTDNKGRLWIESSNGFIDPKVKGKLYRMDPDYITKDIQNNNLSPFGMGISYDNKTIFEADLKENVIYKYKYSEKDGSISNPTTVFNVTEEAYFEGHIGSITVGKDNSLWIALMQSGTIIQYDFVEKAVKQYFLIPSKYPMSMAFGGPRMDVLFIGTLTTSKESGGVFAVSGTGNSGHATYPVAQQHFST